MRISCPPPSPSPSLPPSSQFPPPLSHPPLNSFPLSPSSSLPLSPTHLLPPPLSHSYLLSLHLSLPPSLLQVEVIINRIPSSCLSGGCSFNYSIEATPLVEAVYPSSGQQGTEITIVVSGFRGDSGSGDSGEGDSSEGVRVWLGEVECDVTTVSDSEISCIVQPHPAGSVIVTVHVPGSGYATAVNDSTVCFQYLLTLTAIQPTRGSTEGGTPVTLTGHGFLPTVTLETSAIGDTLANMAWFSSGFGRPLLPPPHTLCPDLAEELVNFSVISTDDRTLQQRLLSMYDRNTMELDLDHLQMMIANFYRDFPIQVYIGSSPCIVTSADLNELNCTTTRHEDGSANITVIILGETASYESGYTYDEDLTPAVTGISPTSGPVYGGTALTIEGRSLQHTTSVLIGDAPCIITSQSSVGVVCNTTNHEPSTVPVIVSTMVGVARVAMEGSGEALVPRESPFLFSYELEVNSVGPLRGSVRGGLLLTIEGRGFHPSLTSVLMGGRLAALTSVDETVITCLTPPPTTTHTVTFLDQGFNVGE